MRLTGMAMLGVVISVAGVLVGHHAALLFPSATSTVDGAPALTAGHGVASSTMQTPASPAKARRVYPFSIVPGGVLDRAELARVIKRDKVAAAHYAGFQADQANTVTVAKARAVYVSYRKDGQVYWTSKKVMLAEGETLLSDGTSEIRTRCGNRISETRRLPVAANEPAPEVLDTAMQADDDEGGAQPVSMAPADDGPGGIGAIRTPVTFANGAALVQAGPQHTSAPVTPLGISDLPRGYNGRPATIAAPQAAQLNRTLTGRGSGDSGTRTDAASSGADPSAGGLSDTGLTTQPSPLDPANPLGGGAPVLASTGDPSNGGASTPSSPELPPLSGTLAPVPSTPLVPGQANPDTANVPEPGSLWLSGIALAGLAVLRRKTRQPR